MMLWVVLFVLVLAISFVLAVRSMRDFTEIPQSNEEYSLFLIRKTSGLSAEFFNSVRDNLLHSAKILSLERLFKGKKRALVVFGPKDLLLNYKDSLDMLELEDYTNVDVNYINAWEVGIKNPSATTLRTEKKIFENLPQFEDSEQFWWQVIFTDSFKVQITAVVVSHDSVSRNSLSAKLNLSGDDLSKLPKAFSNEQLLDFYQKRSFRKDSNKPTLSFEKIQQLLLA